jgi:hypothetical protein
MADEEPIKEQVILDDVEEVCKKSVKWSSLAGIILRIIAEGKAGQRFKPKVKYGRILRKPGGG